MEQERKLDLKEKPLVVQLHWNTDNREGRFVLRNDQDILLEVTGLSNPDVRRIFDRSCGRVLLVTLAHRNSSVNKVVRE